MKRKEKIYKRNEKCPESRPCLWLHARQASNSLLCKDCHQAVCCTNILCLHTVMSQKEMTENQYVKRSCSKTKQSFLQNNITNIQLYIQYIYKYAWQIIAVIRQPKSAMSDRILIYCIYIYIYKDLYWHAMLSRFWPGTSFYHLGNTYVIIRAQCFKTLQEQKQFEPALKDGRTGCVCSVIVSMTQLRLHREHGSCDTHTWSAVSARHVITRNPIKPRYEACLIPKHPKVSNQNSMLCACVCVFLLQCTNMWLPNEDRMIDISIDIAGLDSTLAERAPSFGFCRVDAAWKKLHNLKAPSNKWRGHELCSWTHLQPTWHTTLSILHSHSHLLQIRHFGFSVLLPLVHSSHHETRRTYWLSRSMVLCANSEGVSAVKPKPTFGAFCLY